MVSFDDAIYRFSGNLLHIDFVLIVIPGPSFCLREGTSSYDFSFQLKRKLPSSFSGAYGKIKYKMAFVIDKPWKFDEKQHIVISVIQLLDITSVPDALLPLERQTTRNIGYIGSGPITMQVLTPKCFYVPGEKLPIQVVITNNSRINVDKVKFSLHKIISYHSSMPNRVRKIDVQKIMKKEAGGVAKKTEKRYQHEIEIPVATPSQTDEVSLLIHIQYELRVEAKVSGLYKNIIQSLPLTIGNVPANGSLALPLPATSAPVAVPYGPPYSLNRLSMTSNSSFRLVSSTSPGSICSSGRLDRSANTSYLTDTDSIISATDSTLSRASNSFSSYRSGSISSAAITDTSLSSMTSSSSQFHPSAPPLDLSAINISQTSTSTQNSVCLDAPPSYDEVFGIASTSLMYPEAATSSPNCPNAQKI